MAQTAPAPTEKTFTKYTPDQATNYTEYRRNYHPSVYNFILDHHTKTNGGLDSLLDIGCGPGLATRSLAPHFQHATGLDPSPGMITTANTLLATSPATASGAPIRYAVSSAEELAGIPDDSVDLITTANAAHWFSSMPHFWARAAAVLKPGGTVAIWTTGALRAHPRMPNAEKIQAAFDRYVYETMADVTDKGNVLVRDKYRGLAMPWECEPKVEGLEEEDFVRREWGVEEQFVEGQEDGGVGLKVVEKMLGTGSVVARWREKNPELVGTENDVVKLLVKELGELLRETGVKEGEEKLSGVMEGVVLLVKKKGAP